MKFDSFIFDFDGTLADTGDGVMASVSYALEKMKHSPLPEQLLRSFIGPSLYSSFTGLCKMTDEEALAAIEHYREFYMAGGVYRCRLYDGIAELLQELSLVGSVSVASAKPQPQLNVATACLGVDKLAKLIVGADPTVKSNDKSDLLRRAIDGKSPVMIGDSLFDIRAAKAVGIPSIAVSYGFTDAETLALENPDYTAATVEELKRILLER